MGAEDRIEKSPEFNTHYETNEYEQFILDSFIYPYENDFFWDELIHRLSERDLIHNVGKEQFSKMDFIERMTKVNDMRDSYENEFEKHGLNHLKLATVPSTEK